METPKTIYDVSIDTLTIQRRLATLAIGETVDYRALSELIGRDVQRGGRHVLGSAIRRLQRDEHVVLAAVKGVGVQRLNDTQIASVGDGALARVRNIARRTRAALGCVQDFDGLPDAAKIKHNVAASVLGAIAHLSTPHQVRKLETRVSNAQCEALPVAKFLDAVRSGL